MMMVARKLLGKYPSDWLTLDGTLQTIAECDGPFTEISYYWLQVTPTVIEIYGTYIELRILFQILKV